jgi:hypothetical protein
MEQVTLSGDSTIRIAVCNGNARTTAVEPREITFDDLVAMLSDAQIGDKDGPYYLRGGDLIKPIRGNENLKSADLLIIDGDSGFDPATGEITNAPSMGAVTSVLKFLKLRYIAHTTHSYIPGVKWKYRIAGQAKLKHEADLKACVAWIMHQLHEAGVYLTDVKENSTWAQAWYKPRVADAEALKHFRADVNLDGKPLNVADCVAWWIMHDEEGEAQEEKILDRAQERADVYPSTGSTLGLGPILGESVIKQFNADHGLDWVRAELERQGYKFSHHDGRKNVYRYIRPGSETGIAGVMVFEGKLGDWCTYSHHGGEDPLSHKVCDPFEIYAIFQHGGDRKAAARSLMPERPREAPADYTVHLEAESVAAKPEPQPKAGNPEPKPEAVKPHKIHASPFTLVPEDKIPPRDWVYGRHLIRRFVSATVAPGGVGKSSLTFAEAMAMVTGKPLLGVTVARPLKVWVWCLEDPREELDRRFAAIAKHYKITDEDIGGRLFLNSGRDTPLCVARQETKTGAIIVEPDMGEIEQEITSLGIDVLLVDPFVASHQVSENDNVAINAVMRQWVLLAERCNVAIELIHHTRKNGDGEVTAETSRGAKALTDATRDTRVINQMSEAEAAKFGVENRRLHFRAYSDKANLAPPAERSDWYMLENVALANGPLGADGDRVGVAARWEVPGPFDKVGRETVNAILTAIDIGMLDDNGEQTGIPFGDSTRGGSKRWVGQVVMDHTGMEEEEAKRAIAAWIKSGVLEIEEVTIQRKARKAVKVNRKMWAEMAGGSIE